MTVHQPLASVPPVINGTPPAAALGQPYDFTVVGPAALCRSPWGRCRPG
jgi:hypothetical protein